MKWGFRAFGAAVLVLALALGALAMVSEAWVTGWITKRLAQSTGREVRILGEVELSVWPVLGIRADGLEIGNADWAGEAPLLSSSKAAIGLQPLALLRGETRIRHIEARSPTIRLARRADGRVNWRFDTPDGNARAAEEPVPDNDAAPLSIDRLTVTNASIIYEAEGAEPVTVDELDLSMVWPDPAGAAEISASYRPAGSPVRLRGRVETFDRFLAGELTPLEASLSARGGKVALEGRGALKGAMAGHLRASGDDADAFLSALGFGAGALPALLGKNFDVKAQTTLTAEGQLALRDMEAAFGENRLRGTADVTLRDVPYLRAKLEADDLRLTSRGKTRKTSPEAGGRAGAPSGWSQVPIDASALAGFDGEITLDAQSITLDRLNLGRSRLALRNDRSRMVFALEDVTAYDGRITGEFVMNNRQGLSVGGNLTAKTVALQPLLTDLADLERFSGQGTATLSFLGVGENVAEIMQSLSGSGEIEMGRGVVEGIDLDNLLGSHDVAGGSTVFDTAGASFRMEKGVLRNDDLTMTLPRFIATGAGEVDFGARRLDYTISPQRLRADGARGVAVPVRITGPWHDPRIRPNLRATIELNTDRNRTPDRDSRQELDEAINRELDRLTRPDPQPQPAPQPQPEAPQPERPPAKSLEDLLLEQVEDALKRELLKIFD